MQTILKVQINLCSSDSGQTNIHEINIPLAHYFPSYPTDTSCSASQRTNQRSSRWSSWEQTPSHPPHTPFRRPFCLPLFSLCLAGDEYSTPPLLLLQWAARNARVIKNSWQMSFLQHLLRGEPFTGLVCLTHPAKLKTDRSILHDIEEYLRHCYCA